MCGDCATEGKLARPCADQASYHKKYRDDHARRSWNKRLMQRQDAEEGAWRSARRIRVERVVSCRSRGHRWRTKLNLGSGEPLDNLHGSSTLGAGWG